MSTYKVGQLAEIFAKRKKQKPLTVGQKRVSKLLAKAVEETEQHSEPERNEALTENIFSMVQMNAKGKSRKAPKRVQQDEPSPNRSKKFKTLMETVSNRKLDDIAAKRNAKMDNLLAKKQKMMMSQKRTFGQQRNPTSPIMNRAKANTEDSEQVSTVQDVDSKQLNKLEKQTKKKINLSEKRLRNISARNSANDIFNEKFKRKKGKIHTRAVSKNQNVEISIKKGKQSKELENDSEDEQDVMKSDSSENEQLITIESDIEVEEDVPEKVGKKKKRNLAELKSRVQSSLSAKHGINKSQITSNTLKKTTKKDFRNKGKMDNELPGLEEEPTLLSISSKSQDDEESILQSEDSDSEIEKPSKHNKKTLSPSQSRFDRSKGVSRGPELAKRTLFFGNIPRDMTKEAVKKVFREYGVVESIRFRSVIPVKRVSKNISEIRKECHENVKEHKGYVVFKDLADAENALELNGTVVNGNHIRVDKVLKDGQEQSRDNKRSVFIGGLAFEIDDETVWTTFSKCGKVVYVRIIRDKDTGVGKGFGFVQFEDEESVTAALELNGTELLGRRIRVMHSDDRGSTKKPPQRFMQNRGDNSPHSRFPPKKFSRFPPREFGNFSRFPPRKFGKFPPEGVPPTKFGGNRKFSGSHKTQKKLMKKKGFELKKKKIASAFKSMFASASPQNSNKSS